jgi:hypothetical protein
LVVDGGRVGQGSSCADISRRTADFARLDERGYDTTGLGSLGVLRDQQVQPQSGCRKESAAPPRLYVRVRTVDGHMNEVRGQRRSRVGRHEHAPVSEVSRSVAAGVRALINGSSCAT